MGNRPFILPIHKTKKAPEQFDWGNLKCRFSGQTLFRLKLFNLETGDLSLLDSINNKWFYEELLGFSLSSHDVNLLPALKKIAGSGKYDESFRQRASETAEIIEDQALKKKTPPKTLPGKGDSDKVEYARNVLAGTRYPQTTEILRLLGDKSNDHKRLALFMIGKFKMTDMIQEACECLSIHGLEDDAYSVLLSFGKVAVKEINKYYLTSSGNINTRKTVLRLLSQINQAADLSFLAEQLWSNSRQIREMVLDTLLSLKYSVNGDETIRLKNSIVETVGTLTWIISALVSLQNNNDAILLSEMSKEYARWKNYLLKLLILAFENMSVKENGKSQKENKDDATKSISRMAGIVFDSPDKTKPVDPSDPVYFKKKLKKLQRYFPCEIPEYKSLLEDIINCDYNLLSIWTKACTLRSIQKIEEDYLSESVVALLFSPEEILREESASLITRSDKDLYRKAAERIPEITRKQLDKIIAGESSERGLVYEKARFLSSCFNELNDDELIFLAEKMSFVRHDESGIYSQPSDTILWSFSDDKSYPEVFINLEDNTDPGRLIKDIRDKCSFCYALPLYAVREFYFHYPERSFGIFKYIDKCEE
jgi:hypothetical protein